MEKPRFFFLDGLNRQIDAKGRVQSRAACVAYRQCPERPDRFDFAYSVCNTRDDFDMELAQDIAAGRLFKGPHGISFDRPQDARFIRQAIVKMITVNPCGCFPGRLVRMARKEWEELAKKREKIKIYHPQGAFPELWLRNVKLENGTVSFETVGETKKRSGEPRRSKTTGADEGPRAG